MRFKPHIEKDDDSDYVLQKREYKKKRFLTKKTY